MADDADGADGADDVVYRAERSARLGAFFGILSMALDMAGCVLWGLPFPLAALSGALGLGLTLAAWDHAVPGSAVRAYVEVGVGAGALGTLWAVVLGTIICSYYGFLTLVIAGV